MTYQGLLIFLHLAELGIDDAFFLGRFLCRRTSASRSFLLRLVHGLADLHRGSCQRVGLGLDDRAVAAFQYALEIRNRAFNGGLVGDGNSIANFRKRLFSRVGSTHPHGCGHQPLRDASCLRQRCFPLP